MWPWITNCRTAGSRDNFKGSLSCTGQAQAPESSASTTLLICRTLRPCCSLSAAIKPGSIVMKLCSAAAAERLIRPADCLLHSGIIPGMYMCAATERGTPVLRFYGQGVSVSATTCRYGPALRMCAQSVTADAPACLPPTILAITLQSRRASAIILGRSMKAHRWYDARAADQPSDCPSQRLPSQHAGRIRTYCQSSFRRTWSISPHHGGQPFEKNQRIFY